MHRVVSLQKSIRIIFSGNSFDLSSLDNLTSTLSTFPYTAAQCEKFLELLKMSRGTTMHTACQKKKIRSYVLTLPFFFILEYIHDGHVVAFVG